MKLKPDLALASFHAFGNLVIALHDGRLLALAVIVPEYDGGKHPNDQRDARRLRNRRNQRIHQFKITWGSQFQ